MSNIKEIIKDVAKNIKNNVNWDKVGQLRKDIKKIEVEIDKIIEAERNSVPYKEQTKILKDLFEGKFIEIKGNLNCYVNRTIMFVTEVAEVDIDSFALYGIGMEGKDDELDFDFNLGPCLIFDKVKQNFYDIKIIPQSTFDFYYDKVEKENREWVKTQINNIMKQN